LSEIPDKEVYTKLIRLDLEVTLHFWKGIEIDKSELEFVVERIINSFLEFEEQEV